MINIKILATPKAALFSDIHPFFRWEKQLKDQDIHVSIHFDHRNMKISGEDYVIVNHRYFGSEWMDSYVPGTDNDLAVIRYLKELKDQAKKVIWWDAHDTTVTTSFPVIPYVDVFIKNQTLKNKEYYTATENPANLRVWLDPKIEQWQFYPCPADQLYKIKLAWNLGYNDRRYFPFKLHSLLSNVTSYKYNSLKFTSVNGPRPLDLTFRGKANYDTKFPQHNAISFQRNEVFKLLSALNLNVTYGNVVSKKQYLKELNQSKLSISPFGYGEVCYRDFESFVAGSILIKPSMEHLETFPNLYIPNETYIPVSWDLGDLKEKAEDAIQNYQSRKQIAQNGQDMYRKIINDPQVFIDSIINIIS